MAGIRDQVLPLILPKERLQDGHYYAGLCRNANVARWDAKTNLFYHWRTKFKNIFIETIEYWEVDGHYDGFIPLFEMGPEPHLAPIEIPKIEEK